MSLVPVRSNTRCQYCHFSVQSASLVSKLIGNMCCCWDIKHVFSWLLQHRRSFHYTCHLWHFTAAILCPSRQSAVGLAIVTWCILHENNILKLYKKGWKWVVLARLFLMLNLHAVATLLFDWFRYKRVFISAAFGSLNHLLLCFRRIFFIAFPVFFFSSGIWWNIPTCSFFQQ